MSFTRAVLSAFIGGVLAAAFVLAYRVSRETGKSTSASLVDVPEEAQRVFGEVRTRATEAVNDGRETLRQKEQAVREGGLSEPTLFGLSPAALMDGSAKPGQQWRGELEDERNG